VTLQNLIQTVPVHQEWIAADLARVLRGEQILSGLAVDQVHLSPDEVSLEVAVFVLTANAVVLWRGFEVQPEDGEPVSRTSIVQVLPVRTFANVQVNHTLAEDENGEEVLEEVRIYVSRTHVDTMQVIPNACEEGDCTGEHGFTIDVMADVLAVNASRSNSSPQQVEATRAFGDALAHRVLFS